MRIECKSCTHKEVCSQAKDYLKYVKAFEAYKTGMPIIFKVCLYCGQYREELPTVKDFTR